jgi:cell division protein FtsX
MLHPLVSAAENVASFGLSTLAFVNAEATMLLILAMILLPVVLAWLAATRALRALRRLWTPRARSRTG